MGNCLKTKLNAVVSNDNFHYFDSIMLMNGGGSNFEVKIKKTNNGVLVLDTIGNAKWLNNSGTALQMPYVIETTTVTTYKLDSTDTDTRYFIRGKAGIEKFIIDIANSTVINIDDFYGCINLNTLEVKAGAKTTGNINSLNTLLLLTDLELQSTLVTGSMDELIQYQTINGNPKQMIFRGNGKITIEGIALTTGKYRYITIVSNTQYRVSENSDYSGGNTYNYSNGEWVKEV